MKSILRTCTALALAGMFTGQVMAQEMLQSLGAGEGEVGIIAWAGYIERGETDPIYDWVTKFEADTGCKVNVKIAATSDEMTALMNGEGYDLVTASGDSSLRLIAGKRVQPINTALLPSWSGLSPKIESGAWHTVDGVHYGTPYVWGSNVLMYNTETFGATPPDSWKVVFEKMDLPDGKSNEGRVQAFDGPIYIADAALYLKATKPELGIDDPYALTEEQYAAAIELLRAQRQLVGRYWHDFMLQTDDFKNEGIVASSSWPLMVNLLQAENFPVSSVIPKEGVTGWADTTMMHVNAPHPNCAYMWMEHTLSNKVQGDVAAFFGAVPSVPGACENHELLGPDGCKTNGIDNFDKIAFWKTPVAECAAGTCVPYSRWVSDYIGIMGGR